MLRMQADAKLAQAIIRGHREKMQELYSVDQLLLRHFWLFNWEFDVWCSLLSFAVTISFFNREHQESLAP
jgi:hypothetical protein